MKKEDQGKILGYALGLARRGTEASEIGRKTGITATSLVADSDERYAEIEAYVAGIEDALTFVEQEGFAGAAP